MRRFARTVKRHEQIAHRRVGYSQVLHRLCIVESGAWIPEFIAFASLDDASRMTKLVMLTLIANVGDSPKRPSVVILEASSSEAKAMNSGIHAPDSTMQSRCRT
jgi:hypothetical protein